MNKYDKQILIFLLIMVIINIPGLIGSHIESELTLSLVMTSIFLNLSFMVLIIMQILIYSRK